jgi:hypothetical protein
MEIYPFQEIVMDSSQRYLVDGLIGDERQGTGEAPGNRHEFGSLLPTQ